MNKNTVQMPKRGVGPRIFFLPSLFAVCAGVLTWLFPTHLALHLPGILANLAWLLGGALCLTSALIYVIAGKGMSDAHDQDRLTTRGMYAWTRNPLYFASIFLLFPGIALLSGAWLIFGASFLAYLEFAHHVPREEHYLELRYGQEYHAYKARVPRLLPIPRASAKHAAQCP